MKKIIIFLLTFIIFISNVNAISASSYIVMDINSNNVLLGSNINDKRLIASITKIMTCIVAIENGNLNKNVVASKNILNGTGSSIYIEIAEKIKLKDLLYGMMLRSGNDAAIMVAESVSGSMENFVKLMNDYAKKIGMNDTIFYNSHGLEDNNGIGNISTSYDMALLTSYAYNNEIFRNIFKTKNYSCKSDKKSYNWQNKNRLLKYDYITGGKTGYTIKAKRTLVSTANINDMDIVIVTLNDSNDWDDHISLYNIIRNKFINVKILDKNDFDIIGDNVFISEKFYIKNDYYYVLKKSDIGKLKIVYDLNNSKNSIGYANIYLNDKLIHKENIYKKNNTNSHFSIKNWFKKIFKT